MGRLVLDFYHDSGLFYPWPTVYLQFFDKVVYFNVGWLWFELEIGWFHG